jgi:hypothetical protein
LNILNYHITRWCPSYQPAVVLPHALPLLHHPLPQTKALTPTPPQVKAVAKPPQAKASTIPPPPQTRPPPLPSQTKVVPPISSVLQNTLPIFNRIPFEKRHKYLRFKMMNLSRAAQDAFMSGLDTLRDEIFIAQRRRRMFVCVCVCVCEEEGKKKKKKKVI